MHCIVLYYNYFETKQVICLLIMQRSWQGGGGGGESGRQTIFCLDNMILIM